MKTYRLLPILLIAVSAASCATIFNRPTVVVSVATPANETVIINGDTLADGVIPRHADVFQRRDIRNGWAKCHEVR